MRLLVISGKKALLKKFKDIRPIEAAVKVFMKRKKEFNAIFAYYDDSRLAPPATRKPKDINRFVRQVEAKKGQIDYLLILGGDDVVPFHRLKNPADDDDFKVPSDNPYASRDDEYLIPERAVGRIPDAGDLDFLLGQLQKEPSTKYEAAFGYTARVWYKAAEAVYKVVGDKNDLKRCPPMNSDRFEGKWLQKNRFNYFNLHGSADSANWYGQDGGEYPVALKPENIAAPAGVVVTEACYGAHILKRTVAESIALTLLCGPDVFGVCGSTTIAYGPFEPPSSEADQLAKYFLQYLKVGLDTGTALMNSKIDFAKKKVRKQGFLDEDDQKTLLQFILLGDPTLKVGS